VTLLPTPFPIKAGELIGHIGQYQNYDEATPRALLHLEVFSCDDVPAFITNSRARAASLPNSAKTLLKIHKRASKLIPHREGISASNPPQISDEGVTVGVDLIIPQSLLDTLPSSSKILVPATAHGNGRVSITSAKPPVPPSSLPTISQANACSVKLNCPTIKRTSAPQTVARLKPGCTTSSTAPTALPVMKNSASPKSAQPWASRGTPNPSHN
jgi:hypothetical protein